MKLIKNVQLLWNVHDGHSTDCLAKLFQCLTTHFEELFFPTCNWNFSCCNLFPLCLLLCAPVKCVCFCSQPSIRTQKNATKSLLSILIPTWKKKNILIITAINPTASLCRSCAPASVQLHHCSSTDPSSICFPLEPSGPFLQGCFLASQSLSHFINIHKPANCVLHPTYQFANEGINQHWSLSNTSHSQLNQTPNYWLLPS